MRARQTSHALQCLSACANIHAKSAPLVQTHTSDSLRRASWVEKLRMPRVKTGTDENNQEKTCSIPVPDTILYKPSASTCRSGHKRYSYANSTSTRSEHRPTIKQQSSDAVPEIQISPLLACSGALVVRYTTHVCPHIMPILHRDQPLLETPTILTSVGQQLSGWSSDCSVSSWGGASSLTSAGIGGLLTGEW